MPTDPHEAWTLAAVFLGGGLGSVLRYAVGLWMHERIGPPGSRWHGLPIGTLTVNIVGCLAIGVGVGLLGRLSLPRPVEAGLLVGVLGGFTTFSAFKRETFELMQTGRPTVAAAYVGLSVLAGLVAVVIGARIGGLLPIRPEP